MITSRSPVVAMGVAALLGLGSAAVAAGKPAPPRTSQYSVQMFQGNTQYCWIAVWPPSAYEDGSPIPDGTKVEIRAYRSYDAGKKYGRRGVSVVSGGKGFVGQGEKDARQKRWIDLKLKTPVDNKKPWAVWLAATAVVNGVASKATNRYLTFRYKASETVPRLIRYETPNIDGPGVDDELARPLPQELPKVWPDGELVTTRVWVSPRASKDQREGCTKAMQNSLNKPAPIEFHVDQIDLVGAPGLQGNPIDPSRAVKVHFPGQGKIVTRPKPGAKPGSKPTEMPVHFMYNYRDRTIRLETLGSKGMKARLGGSFYRNATHYTIRGTWKISLYDKSGSEYAWGQGTWMAKKRRR